MTKEQLTALLNHPDGSIRSCADWALDLFVGVANTFTHSTMPK